MLESLKKNSPHKKNKMKRYTFKPYEEPEYSIIEDKNGELVYFDDVIEWLRKQRNDVPTTGEEMANGLIYSIQNEN